MKVLRILGIVCLLVAEALAQQLPKTQYVFTGHIQIGQSYLKYKLAVNNKGGVIDGYSVTDVGGPDETYTQISGYANQRTNTLSFQEEALIKTKSKGLYQNFCYVHADLRLNTSPIGVVLEGPFDGRYANTKKPCGEGVIYLEGAHDIRELFRAIAIPAKPVPDTFNSKYTVTGGSKLKLKARSDSIRFLIWDDMLPDGDLMSIKQGETILLDRYQIQKEVKEIRAVLSEKSGNIFSFTALNVGKRPPNTAKIVVTDGQKTYLVISNVPEKSSFYIQINR